MNKVLRRAFLAVVIALPVLVALTVGVAAVNRFAGPLPPRTFSMSTGREGGAYHQFALEYRRLLARQGFTLVIEPGPGSVETVRRLRRGEVTVGFVQGGTADDSDAEQLVSLASVFYEPLWIFHRRSLRVTSLGELRGRRVAAGEEGSGTRALALQLLAASRVTPQNTDVLALTNDDAEARLRDGRIDAAIFVISPRAAVVDVSDTVRDIPHTGPHNLVSGLIERFADYKRRLEEAVSRGKSVPLGQVKIRPPLPKPTNIECMAVNYMEDGTRSEPAPINAFHKSPSAIIGPEDTMVLPDVPATIFEGEAEVALVIGKRASNVRAADAMSYVFGYTNFIDGSARGLLPAGNTFYQMKSRDTFAPIGPWIVTADEIVDPHKLQVRLWVNGELKQNFNTSDMAHKIPRCIEWVTSIHTLEPGDILATGTNHRGLSGFQNGDRIELETDGLGRLRFNVRDDLKRTWSRETRLDRQQKGQEGTTPQVSGKHTPPPR